MRKFVSKNKDVLYIGTAREIMSLMKNLEKRDIAVNPFTDKVRCDMQHMYGLLIEYYSGFEDKRFETPQMTISSANNALIELCHSDYEWKLA